MIFNLTKRLVSLIGAVFAIFLVIGEDASAGADSLQTSFAPAFPFRTDTAPIPMNADQIRAALVNHTHLNIDKLNRYYFFENGQFKVQPVNPPSGKSYSWQFNGTWSVQNGRYLCLELNKDRFDFLADQSTCFNVFSYNQMIIGADINTPRVAAFVWNEDVAVRMPLFEEQHELFLSKIYPAIIKAEASGNQEAPKTSVDKWNPPVDEDMRALHRFLENEGAINRRNLLHLHHKAGGKLIITSDRAAGQSVEGRWWISDRLYCNKYAPAGMAARTFCYSPDILAYKKDAKGPRVKKGQIGLFGRSILTLPKGLQN